MPVTDQDRAAAALDNAMADMRREMPCIVQPLAQSALLSDAFAAHREAAEKANPMTESTIPYTDELRRLAKDLDYGDGLPDGASRAVQVGLRIAVALDSAIANLDARDQRISELERQLAAREREIAAMFYARQSSQLTICQSSYPS